MRGSRALLVPLGEESHVEADEGGWSARTSMVFPVCLSRAWPKINHVVADFQPSKATVKLAGTFGVANRRARKVQP